jgi:GGDEF domain-containing protein
VVAHHSALGLLNPTEVFNHPAALRSPWKWASTALEDAVATVERLRAATPLVTCSVGLAWWNFREASAELLARADQALYVAKAEGRNRYVLAS